jgi:hypothetical protein
VSQNIHDFHHLYIQLLLNPTLHKVQHTTKLQLTYYRTTSNHTTKLQLTYYRTTSNHTTKLQLTYYRTTSNHTTKLQLTYYRTTSNHTTKLQPQQLIKLGEISVILCQLVIRLIYFHEYSSFSFRFQI